MALSFFAQEILERKEVGKREKWAVYYLVLLPQFDKTMTKTKNEENWYISMAYHTFSVYKTDKKTF